MEPDFLCRDRAAEKLSMLFQSRATVELEPVVAKFPLSISVIRTIRRDLIKFTARRRGFDPLLTFILLDTVENPRNLRLKDESDRGTLFLGGR